MDKMVRLEENIKKYAWGEAVKMTLYGDFLIQILTKSEEA
jgi:mannose-6-phosphate isomerase class I